MLQNHIITDRNVFPHLLDRSIWFSVFAATILIFIGCNHRSSPDKAGIPATINVSDTIAIGFYNVENLFDLNYDGDEYPEYRPGALGWNKQTWEKKVYNIASAIAAMNVAVIGLCEVENRNALEDLRKELGNLGADVSVFRDCRYSKPYRDLSGASFEAAGYPLAGFRPGSRCTDTAQYSRSRR